MSDDGQTIVSLFHEHADALYRSALRMLGDAGDAEDAVQDVFVRLRRTKQPLSELDRPDAWLFAVLRNVCIDRKRRSARERERLGSSADGLMSPSNELIGRQTINKTPETEVLSAETLREVGEAIDALPRAEAEALTLVAIEGLSYRDVADITDVPVGTVRSRLSRARKALRIALHAALANGPAADGPTTVGDENTSRQNVIPLRRTSQ